ncbi:hypothetical protein ACFE04_006876 [Oxalis oulophora]
MDDLEAPSFSLGFDLDLDTQPEPPPTPFHNPNPNNPIQESKEDELWGEVMDSDPEAGSDPPRILKRLRRAGVGAGKGLEKKKDIKEVGPSGGAFNAVDCDDDIEEFSSPEDFIISSKKDERSSRQLGSVCSSSKISLRGSGVLTTQSVDERNIRKKDKNFNVSESATAPTPLQGSLFPKLTISPLRKFQLIESDSDDPRDNVGKMVHDNGEQSTKTKQKSTSIENTQKDDLWEDFFSTKSYSMPTPALDKFCEEYYQTVNRKVQPSCGVRGNENKACHLNKISGQNFEQCWDLPNPLPPAHRYFFHNDPRIQKLVRSRLPNFFPLGTTPTGGNDQSTTQNIDYLGQFTNGETSKHSVARKTTKASSSARGRNRSKKSNFEEVPQTSQGWVDPRSSATIPKDAGRKRVHGSSQSAGYWHTTPEGRKAYVSKSGQELTGSSAYRLYKKESGKAVKKSRKRTTAKK